MTWRIDNCFMVAADEGLCRAHRTRERLRGDPLAGRSVPGMLKAFIIHAVESDTDDCIVWPFYKHRKGYGLIKWDSNWVQTHRLSLSLKSGVPFSTKLHALHDPHACSERACINPRHLRWGTNDDNVADRTASGNTLRGEDVGTATLTEDEVKAIWFDDRPLRKIASARNVPVRTIRNIKERLCWVWLTDQFGGGRL